jgi:hypothetical protein
VEPEHDRYRSGHPKGAGDRISVWGASSQERYGIRKIPIDNVVKLAQAVTVPIGARFLGDGP